MGNWLKCFATVAMMVTLVYGRPYAGDRDMLRGGELFSLSLFALLGMFVMISGNNFLLIYLGLELLTLSSYALVALRRDHAQSTEAAMKYFVLGALASGFLLYGLSMMYGATGTLDINRVFDAIFGGQHQRAGPDCSAPCSWSPAWPSSWARAPSTCGCPTSTRARPRR
jgi:NADH-quinone oxidoreductase subunit N